MPTPIGHSLLGLAIAKLTGRGLTVPSWRWYALAVFAANAPDLDLLIGMLFGDANRFHQGPSHSFTAALLFGLLCGSASRWLGCSAVFAAGAAATMYASHLLLDFFASDGRAPYGQPLLWPFIPYHWIAEHPVFSGIQHGVPGDSLRIVMGEIFSMVNLTAIGIELIWLAPVLAGAWILPHIRTAVRHRWKDGY